MTITCRGRSRKFRKGKPGHLPAIQILLFNREFFYKNTKFHRKKGAAISLEHPEILPRIESSPGYLFQPYGFTRGFALALLDAECLHSCTGVYCRLTLVIQSPIKPWSLVTLINLSRENTEIVVRLNSLQHPPRKDDGFKQQFLKFDLHL